MSPEHEVPELRELAELYGVQAEYRDNAGELQRAAPEALLAVLQALDAPVAGLADVDDAIRERIRSRWRRVVEPVTVTWPGGTVAPSGPGRDQPGVAWGAHRAHRTVGGHDDATPTYREYLDPHRGGLPGALLHVPVSRRDATLRVTLTDEAGAVRRWDGRMADLAGHVEEEIDGEAIAAAWLPLPPNLAAGYHDLVIELDGERHESLVIDAPLRAYDPFAGVDADGPGRAWGVFAPLYAVHGAVPEADPVPRSGLGDLGHLERMAEWVGGLGGDLVGTLPLLASYLDEPFDPSPYAPVSRLFWNDLYIDLSRAPGLDGVEAARAALRDPEVRDALGPPAMSDGRPERIDYRRIAAARRRVLEPLARAFFDAGGAEDPEYRRFLEERPGVEDYARFRAAAEARGGGWRSWPAPLRGGALGPDDVAEDAARYHRFAQWLAERQMAAAARHADRAGVGYYIDLPLGVNPDGYDVWRWPSLFVEGASGGSPPDAFFSRGQDWGFPPMHPGAIREDRHAYTIACYRQQLRHARALRIDHVMSLHRMYWVPEGADARDGVYVRYPANELYAILCLESHRHRALLVGEDLGTVPEEVRAAMDIHDIRRMYVAEFEARPDPEDALPAPPAGAVASVDTHDVPTFAGFWRERDIDDRLDLGLLDEAGAREERARRARLRAALSQALGLTEGDAGPVLAAILERLARSDAGVVLATLEDLWLEEEPQNVPGTGEERPNWRRRMRHALDDIMELPEVASALRRIDEARAEGGRR